MPTGTLVLPNPSDVRLNVGYGAGGTEFFGTMVAPQLLPTADDNSPAEIAAQLLVLLGYGTDSDTWPVYATNEPSSPDNCITVKDTDGKGEGRVATGELQEHQGIQIRVRSADHPTGWAKCTALRNGMATGFYDRTVVIGARQYLVHCFANIGRILPLGKDTPATKRSVFTINALISYTKVA